MAMGVQRLQLYNVIPMHQFDTHAHSIVSPGRTCESTAILYMTIRWSLPCSSFGQVTVQVQSCLLGYPTLYTIWDPLATTYF